MAFMPRAYTKHYPFISASYRWSPFGRRYRGVELLLLVVTLQCKVSMVFERAPPRPLFSKSRKCGSTPST